MGLLYTSQKHTSTSLCIKDGLWLEQDFDPDSISALSVDFLFFPTPLQMPDVFFFDMDGTLLDIETLDEVARTLGINTESITLEAMRGQSDFRESLQKRLRILDGAPLESFYDLAKKLPLQKNAQKLKELPYPKYIVTGGFDIFAKTVCQSLSFDGYFAHSLKATAGRFCGDMPTPVITSEQKAKYVQRICQSYRFTSPCVIGDGANDLDMLSIATHPFGFRAKEILRPHVNGQLRDYQLLVDSLSDLVKRS